MRNHAVKPERALSPEVQFSVTSCSRKSKKRRSPSLKAFLPTVHSSVEARFRAGGYVHCCMLCSFPVCLWAVSPVSRARSIPGLKPLLPFPTYDSRWFGIWDLGFKAVIWSLRAPLDGEV